MALTFLENTEASISAEAAVLLGQCKDAYRRKLYHQLTDSIEELVKLNPSGVDWIEFELKFIRDFRQHMNLLRYASICVLITNKEGGDMERNIRLINESIESDVIKKSATKNDALLLLKIQLSNLHLKSGNKVKSKELLNDIETEMENKIKIPDGIVFANYHLVKSKYFKNEGDKDNYYKHIMSYLGYINITDLTDEEGLDLAYNISLNALTSKYFYDFGQLSLHPIITYLKNSPKHQYLFDIIHAFIVSKLDLYNTTMKKYSSEIAKEKMLSESVKTLDEKIRLLSLVRLAFYKPSFERILSFKEIEVVSDCSKENIEKLIIKSMSASLLVGTIDQINETLTVTYVKPRILDEQEIASMKDRIGGWVGKIETIHEQVRPMVDQLFS